MQHNPQNEGPDQPSSAQPESKTRDATAGLAIEMMLSSASRRYVRQRTEPPRLRGPVT